MRERGAPPGRGLATVHAAVARGGRHCLVADHHQHGPAGEPRRGVRRGRARSLRRRRTRSLPDARALLGRLGRVRVGRAAGRHLRGRAPKGYERGGGAPAGVAFAGGGAAEERARFRSPPRTVGGAAKPPVAGAAATSPLPWKRIPPWKATRTRRRCFRSRRRRARRRRGRARPASRGSPRTPTRRARAAARPRVERRGARDGIRTRTDPRHGNDNRSLRVRYLNGLLPNVLAFLDAPLGPAATATAASEPGTRFARSPARLGGARLGLVGGVDAHGGGHGRGRVEVGDAPVVLALLRARKPGRRVQRVTDLALPVLVRGQVPRPGAVCRTSRGRKASAKRPKRVSFLVDRSRDFGRTEKRRYPDRRPRRTRSCGGTDGQRGRAGR